MPGKKRFQRKREYVPTELVKHIEREMKEIHKINPTRVEAMERIARKLDELIIKKRRNLKI